MTSQHMNLVLASRSEARARLLRNAGVAFTAMNAGVDEETVIEGLLGEGITPRDLADALAELKALRVSGALGEGLVLGSDQVLACEGKVFQKAPTMAALRAQLEGLRGRPHELFSAACLARNGAIIWRHVGRARLWMRDFSPAFLDRYLEEEGAHVLGCVGGYRIEAMGAQLFSKIEGDGFTIEGLPLIEVLDALRTQGVLPR